MARVVAERLVMLAQQIAAVVVAVRRAHHGVDMIARRNVTLATERSWTLVARLCSEGALRLNL